MQREKSAHCFWASAHHALCLKSFSHVDVARSVVRRSVFLVRRKCSEFIERTNVKLLILFYFPVVSAPGAAILYNFIFYKIGGVYIYSIWIKK